VFRGHGRQPDFRVRYVMNEATPGSGSSRDVRFENLKSSGFVIGPTRDIAIDGGDWAALRRRRPGNKITPALTRFPAACRATSCSTGCTSTTRTRPTFPASTRAG
jgi:hypothetical protein